jgi:hypothetical protein
MSIILANEGTIKSTSAWGDDLQIEPNDVQDLVYRGVLSRLDYEMLRLDCVGVFIFKRHLVFAAPKYWDPTDKSYSNIVDILRTYFSRGNRQALNEHANIIEFKDESTFREFDALMTLLSWYKEHGIYTREQRGHSISNGRVNWFKTLSSTSPLFSSGSAVYPYPISASRTNITNEISFLQLLVLKILLIKYEIALPHSIEIDFNYLKSHLPDDPFSEEGKSYYLSRLERERLDVFRTDRLVLLDLLIECLRGFNQLSGYSRGQFYGTNAFYAVWEDACRYFLVNDLIQNDIKIAQPKWHLWDGIQFNKEFDGGQQRPDIIKLDDGNVIILDAKYYYPFPNAFPGWQDIVKQLYYLQSITSHLDAQRINAFLFPDPSAVDFKFAGKVAVESNSHPIFPEIEAWLVNPTIVFNHYRSSTGSNTSIIFNDFLSRRKTVREVLTNTHS